MKAKLTMNGKYPAFEIPAQLPAWSRENVSAGTKIALSGVRFIPETEDPPYWVILKAVNEGQTKFVGSYLDAGFEGNVSVTLDDNRVPGNSLITGLLSVDHRKGTFSGNIELQFHITRALSPIDGRWFVPSFNYYGNPYGKGKYPHPGKICSIGVRADRCAQPFVSYSEENFGYTLGLYKDAPISGSLPGYPASLNWQVHSGPPAVGITLSVMYPFWEYGHSDRENEDVYYKKGEFQPAKRALICWDNPVLLELPFHLWLQEGETHRAYAVISRHVWQKAEQKRLEQMNPLYWEMAERIRFLNVCYYDPGLTPGHYRGNMSKNYAEIGFLCRSLESAYLDWWEEEWGSSAGEARNGLRQRGLHALKHWAQSGLEHGFILPRYDGNKFYLAYSEAKQGIISTRVTAESADIFTRAYSLSVAAHEPVPLFRQVAEAQLDWLLARRQADHTFARSYTTDGQVIEKTPVASGIVITTLAEAARIFERPDYLEKARLAYETYRAVVIVPEAYYGGTLDADTEDKEAAYFALDAAIALYRFTRDPSLLEDAKKITDHILTYTWAYRIQTFALDSAANIKKISTWGATSVSPENQHLDPYPNANVILTGLFSNEPLYTELGLAILHFALDGRWSIPQGPSKGRKQPEQLLHTDWYYNVESVIRRGEYRDIEEEWGWPQVVPCLEFLRVGGVCIDLKTGNGVGIDGCEVEMLGFSPEECRFLIKEILGKPHRILIKLLGDLSSGYRIQWAGKSMKMTGHGAEQGVWLNLKKGQTVAVKVSGFKNKY